MKQNRDKLNDALGMVDETMVQGAMSYTDGMRAAQLSRRATFRRRVTVLAAACLSMALLVGAMLVLPLMKPDEPPVIVDTTEGEENFYVEAPLVKVIQLSATETTTISDPSIPVDFVDVGMEMTQFGTMYAHPVLMFDCQPGEKVTVKAERDCLGYVDMPWGEGVDRSEFRRKTMFIKHLRNPAGTKEEGVVYYTDTLTIDPSKESITVSNLTTRESLYVDPETNVEDIVLNFTITNEEGQITGAGSLYIGRKYLLNHEERFPALAVYSIRRSAVLGSVRFNDPAKTTEEDVHVLLDTFNARTDEVKATLDYSPVTAEEFNEYAMTDLYRTEFAGQQIISRSGPSYYSWCDFAFCEYEADGTDTERNFILFGDGTWVEYRRTHGDCTFEDCHAGCPNTDPDVLGGHHAIGLGCRFRTYDGRIYEVQKVSPDSDKQTLVLIKDANA